MASRDVGARTYPAYAFALAVLSFAAAAYLDMTYVFMLGFWDGTTSELERAEEKLATCLIWFSLAMGAWLVYLGIRAFRRDIGRKLLYSLIVYLVLIVVALAIDRYFATHLMDSAGG